MQEQSHDARASPPERSRRASAFICFSIADWRSRAVDRSARSASRMGRVSSLSAICACAQLGMGYDVHRRWLAEGTEVSIVTDAARLIGVCVLMHWANCDV